MLWGANPMQHQPNTTPSAGTPETIEMPASTVWPMVLALGLALSALSVALGAVALGIIGGLLTVISLVKWMALLLPGQGHEFVAVSHPFPAEVVGQPGTVEQLKPGVMGYRFRLPEKHHPISAGLKGGLAGGLVMPIPAIGWSLITHHGVWFPVNLLSGMALPGVQSLSIAELQEFRLPLFLLGLVIHVVMSATVGLMYGVMLPTIPGKWHWHLLIGGFLLPLIWTGLSYGMMGVVNPLLQRYVDWYWFALSQLAFGIVAALVVIRSEKTTNAPVGSTDARLPSPIDGGQL